LFKKIIQTRTSEKIADQVFESIMRGDLKPNDKLPNEHELCNVFGVSRVTVREAIRALEQYGIVEVRQGSLGGSYIKDVGLGDIAEQMIKVFKMTNMTFSQLSEARVGIESAVFNQLKQREISQKEFLALEKTLADAESFAKQGKTTDRLRSNFDFHVKLVAMSKNPIFIVTYNMVVYFSYQFFKSVQASDKMIQNTFDRHREIVQLMKKRDFDQACEACVKHIDEAGKGIVEKSKYQSRFK
jgi:DNA-binding FadR family transcriptional regulator